MTLMVSVFSVGKRKGLRKLIVIGIGKLTLNLLIFRFSELLNYSEVYDNNSNVCVWL